MTTNRDLLAAGGVAKQNRPVNSKNLPRLNISPQNPWQIYEDELDAIYDAQNEIVNEYNEKNEDIKNQMYEEEYEEAYKEYEWINSNEYFGLVQQATECYESELAEHEEWINECENWADEAPYRKGSLPYIARKELQLYVDELNASCGVVQNTLACDCGYNDTDYDVDMYGCTRWSGPFIEFCCCYANYYSDDSSQMVHMKTLRYNYKNSKDKIKPDFSSAYKEMDSLKIKHYAYLAELKHVPCQFNLMK